MYNFSCHLTCKHCQTSLWVFIITHFQLVIATLMENDFKSKCFHCSVLRLYLSNRKKNQPTIFSFCSISSIPERDGELKSTGKYLAIHIFIYWDNLLPCWCKFLWFQGKNRHHTEGWGPPQAGQGWALTTSLETGKAELSAAECLIKSFAGGWRPLTD